MIPKMVSGGKRNPDLDALKSYEEFVQNVQKNALSRLMKTKTELLTAGYKKRKLSHKKSSKKESLILERFGKFILETYGDHHCGVGRVINVHYFVTCVCEINSLDYRGFLFDQLEVQKYFDSLTKSNLSCEKLARVQVPPRLPQKIGFVF